MKKIIASMLLAGALLVPFSTHAMSQEEYDAKMTTLIDQLTALLAQLQEMQVQPYIAGAPAIEEATTTTSTPEVFNEREEYQRLLETERRF